MDGTTREFTLDSMGARLILSKGADDLEQKDFDLFYKFYGGYAQGNYRTEDEGKTLRAALEARWIESLTFPDGEVKTIQDVNRLHPQRKVRWAAMQIDAVIAKAREIPIPLSSKPPTTPSENSE